MNAEELNKRFTYRTPKEDQPLRYETLRASGRSLAEIIEAQKSLAITKLEEAIWANASIARNE